jgi:hypothetical protein
VRFRVNLVGGAGAVSCRGFFLSIYPRRQHGGGVFIGGVKEGLCEGVLFLLQRRRT